jgi:heavy metal sensor kinase
VKPLPLRTTLSLAYTAVLAVVLTALGFGYHSLVLRQLDAEATASLKEKARGLHGYLRFDSGAPVLSYDRSDPEEVAFISDATRYYQVYDATSGRLLTQSPGMESLGLHYTPAEIAELRSRSEPHDVHTDRGRLRVSSTLIPAAAGQTYLVQVGELLDVVDRSLVRTEALLLWRSLAGLAVAALVGRWLAGLALAPLARLATSTRTIGIGRLHDRLPLRGAGDELDQVADAFNQALGRVEKSVGEMRQFSAALAHELRTPIAILRGEAELELARPLAGDARRERLISQVEEYDRLTRLINQILTLARAEAGDIKLSTAPVLLGRVATAVTEQIEPVASAHHLTLTCEVESDVTVDGDAGWLERLLLILLDNAIKYTADDGRVWVRVFRDDDAALLTVRDSGVGISPEALPHLFDRFYRAEGGTARHASGAGLGLALAKWIVEHHGGTIDVSSTPGAGSTFAVRLPASHAPAAGAVELAGASLELPPEH